jgi:hypothetical protein
VEPRFLHPAQAKSSPLRHVLIVDAAIHAYFTERFPTATARLDSVLEFVFNLLTHSAFALIVTLILIVLGGTEKVSVRDAVCMFGAWLVAFIWIARSKPVRAMSVVGRLVVVSFCGILLAALAIRIDRLGLAAYGANCPDPLHYSFIDLGYVKGRRPNEYSADFRLTDKRDVFRFKLYPSAVVNWDNVTPDNVRIDQVRDVSQPIITVEATSPIRDFHISLYSSEHIRVKCVSFEN